MVTILLGIAVSVAAEVVTWLNKKLSGTLLKGKGSFILAFVVSIVGALVKVIFFDQASIVTWEALWTALAQVWTVAQLFFMIVVETLKLDVRKDDDPTGVW